jgi:hypothetical protein
VSSAPVPAPCEEEVYRDDWRWIEIEVDVKMKEVDVKEVEKDEMRSNLRSCCCLFFASILTAGARQDRRKVRL